jgi:hypothetical protein
MVTNGKVEEVKTEEYLLPNGEREFVRTVQADGNINTKKYVFRRG